MSNLIFEEIPDSLDSDWIHGAIVGGLSGIDNEMLASSYFASGDRLINQILDFKEPAYEYLYPILFLYRHGIELYLKAIVRPKHLNHSIGSLFDAFCRHVYSSYNQKVPPWVTKPITQLAEFDPESDLFRYEVTRNPKRSERLLAEGEFWVDLPKLREFMANIDVVFRRVLAADKYGISGVHTVFKRYGCGVA